MGRWADALSRTRPHINCRARHPWRGEYIEENQKREYKYGLRYRSAL